MINLRMPSKIIDSFLEEDDRIEELSKLTEKELLGFEDE